MKSGRIGPSWTFSSDAQAKRDREKVCVWGVCGGACVWGHVCECVCVCVAVCVAVGVGG